jgi:hypothetical protein
LSFAFTERFLDPVYAPNRLFGQAMLPDADDFPSSCLEFPVHPAVPKSVGRNLLVPELSICLWTLIAPRTTVPEAAVDKNNEAMAKKRKVRLTKQAHMTPPAGDRKTLQSADQSSLRRGVAPAGYLRHDERSLRF